MTILAVNVLALTFRLLTFPLYIASESIFCSQCSTKKRRIRSVYRVLYTLSVPLQVAAADGLPAPEPESPGRTAGV